MRPLWPYLDPGIYLLSLWTCSLISMISSKVTTLVTRATYLQSCIRVYSSCQKHQHFAVKTRTAASLFWMKCCLLDSTCNGCSRCR